MSRGRKSVPAGAQVTPGNKIAQLRDRLRLNQDEVAAVLGVRRQTISNYELRTNASPNFLGLRKLSEAYGVDLGWWIDGEDTPMRLRSEMPLPDPMRDLLVRIAEAALADAVVRSHDVYETDPDPITPDLLAYARSKQGKSTRNPASRAARAFNEIAAAQKEKGW